MDTQTLTLNSELTLAFPDGFHVLDAEERSRIRFAEEGAGICLSDPDRHIFVSVAWKEVNGFSALILNNHDLAKHMERSVKKSMRQFGYMTGGKIRRIVGGKESEGFCYTYTAQQIRMFGESLVLRRGKTIYYFHFYVRESLKEESLPLWDSLLAAAEWVSI